MEPPLENENSQGNLGGDLLVEDTSKLYRFKKHIAALEKRTAIPVRTIKALNQWGNTTQKEWGSTIFIEIYANTIAKEEGWYGLDVWKPQEYMNVITAYKKYCEAGYAIINGDLGRFQERSTRLWYLTKVAREFAEYVEEHRNGSHESNGHANGEKQRVEQP